MSEERLVAEVPDELKRLVDADSRFNKEIVQAALWREFGGEKNSAIDQRIDEKKKRITVVENELEKREAELEELRRELKALEAKREEKSSKAEQVRDNLENIPEESLTPDNPAVKTQAEKVDMEPAELLKELGYEVDEE
ncbi:hypothetical protein [Natrialba taiwanensis]|uniref:Uncharacterized protein n=1 Tax=Natrialba taiwanensis DSM 12281 TaxID=1230458 RepID=L9ZYQ1_9EURY|nr:hypothetical protein [Natrialba taiwanensis]ELY91444.1 hypothetical protein C484_10466 [Natrialba taiwanensis DSM 12281]